MKKTSFLIFSLLPFFASCNGKDDSSLCANTNSNRPNSNNPGNQNPNPNYSDGSNPKSDYPDNYNSNPNYYDNPNHSNYNDSRKNSYESDAQINTHVQTTLMHDNNLSSISRSVYVQTTNGVVTLTGSVSSKENSNLIERKVKTINGVRKVNNQLTIQP